MVRPPPSNSGEPDAIEFGIAELDARLEDAGISFPIDADQLSEEYGYLTVDVDASGHRITLEDALSECDRQRFSSEQDLLNALHPVFEAKREQFSNSLFGRLRALFPF
jgi:hypothetical protein